MPFFWHYELVKQVAFKKGNPALTALAAGKVEQTLPGDFPGPDGSSLWPRLQMLMTSLDDAKAEDVVSIDLVGKTSLADLMIIATGRSNVHVGSIADKVVKSCKLAGWPSPKVEGLQSCDWVLVDAGDVILHIFRAEVRNFYNLEKIWGGDRPGERYAG